MGGFIIEPSLRRWALVSAAGLPAADAAGVVFPVFVVVGTVFPAPAVGFAPPEVLVVGAVPPATESDERGAPERSPMLSPRAAALALVLSAFRSRVLHASTHRLPVNAPSAIRLRVYP
jgi:hypothetical protein